MYAAPIATTTCSICYGPALNAIRTPTMTICQSCRQKRRDANGESTMPKIRRAETVTDKTTETTTTEAKANGVILKGVKIEIAITPKGWVASGLPDDLEVPRAVARGQVFHGVLKGQEATLEAVKGWLGTTLGGTVVLTDPDGVALEATPKAKVAPKVAPKATPKATPKAKAEVAPKVSIASTARAVANHGEPMKISEIIEQVAARLGRPIEEVFEAVRAHIDPRHTERGWVRTDRGVYKFTKAQ